MHGWTKIRPTLHAVALALFTTTLAACGNVTAGGLGEAAVVVSGDAPDPAATPSTAPVPSPATADGDEGDEGEDEGPEGELEADVSVFLIAVDGSAVPVTDGEVHLEVDLEGVQEPEIGSGPVRATTYTALRMVFTEIDIEVEGGLVIDGEPVKGEVDVEIEATLEVEKALDLDLEDDERAEVLIDLNAGDWLQAVDPVTRSVDAQSFADMVSVRVR